MPTLLPGAIVLRNLPSERKTQAYFEGNTAFSSQFPTILESFDRTQIGQEIRKNYDRYGAEAEPKGGFVIPVIVHKGEDDQYRAEEITNWSQWTDNSSKDSKNKMLVALSCVGQSGPASLREGRTQVSGTDLSIMQLQSTLRCLPSQDQGQDPSGATGEVSNADSDPGSGATESFAPAWTVQWLYDGDIAVPKTKTLVNPSDKTWIGPLTQLAQSHSGPSAEDVVAAVAKNDELQSKAKSLADAETPQGLDRVKMGTSSWAREICGQLGLVTPDSQI